MLPPFFQVEGSAFVRARILGGLLGIHRQQALGMMMDLWALAFEIAKDEPPTGFYPSKDPRRALAAAVECKGDANAFEEAGIVEFLPDGFRVRGLDRYAEMFERRRKLSETRSQAAKRRWEKEKPSMHLHSKTDAKRCLEGDQDQDLLSLKGESPSAGADPAPTGVLKLGLMVVGSTTPKALRDLWNAKAHPDLPRWLEMPKKREKSAQRLLKEQGLDGCQELIERINRSEFLRGKNDRGWRASPDWLLQSDVPAKVTEGKYDDRPGKRRSYEDFDPNGGIMRSYP